MSRAATGAAAAAAASATQAPVSSPRPHARRRRGLGGTGRTTVGWLAAGALRQSIVGWYAILLSALIVSSLPRVRRVPAESPARAAGGGSYVSQARRRLQVVCRVLEGNREVIQGWRGSQEYGGSSRPAQGGT